MRAHSSVASANDGCLCTFIRNVGMINVGAFVRCRIFSGNEGGIVDACARASRICARAEAADAM